jgi:hypothetical protein
VHQACHACVGGEASHPSGGVYIDVMKAVPARLKVAAQQVDDDVAVADSGPVSAGRYISGREGER